jgi:hypothetical protein
MFIAHKLNVHYLGSSTKPEMNLYQSTITSSSKSPISILKYFQIVKFYWFNTAASEVCESVHTTTNEDGDNPGISHCSM